MLSNDKQTETNLSLWKYFTDDAAKIKDRMWTMASWMFTLQAGLLAFTGRYLSTNFQNHLVIENKILVMISAAMGVVLGGYTLFMIQQYGEHIRGMWNRADKVRRQIPGLTEIWLLNDAVSIKEDTAREGKENNSLPAVAWRLMYLCIGFITAFIFVVITAY